ncbi:glycoside hydrolase family 88 protein [Aspergillus fischeri NRRL 181]|uniref:Glycosyl hydrolase family 88 protein n=1 Tax=Neosartorya fischeri (strain ATCC 1020 / DSM 3700 / CBS 544.65 / FGSC A1164 / JCM 1740 / NRRL 181 / WB 181) TaxID=331117 RepID=A1D5D0_NEOFI|nr:glycosyl hydrolase family 88 protein [Aspergillus fischeri NRRL 181]EAW23623.1 glycosyl hydrolase family 88 protein [Aspergillus fischeri NRRL 181]
MDEPAPKRLKSESKHKQNGTCAETSGIPQWVIHALFSESVAAKLWNVASRALGKIEPPTFFPEYTGKDGATYVYRHLSFWTSGFFPGSLYLLLERQTKNSSSTEPRTPHPLLLQHLCQWWTVNLHQNATLNTTHDLGFMIAPWAIKAWELHGDARAFSSLVTAANTLASRFCPKIQSIRSWDTCVTKQYSYTDPSKDFLVIIDNMLNLDMLFWVAKETGNRHLYDVAQAHARTTQKHHIRANHSTYHVVNFDQDTCTPKEKLTNQGYSDESCWARGQAWGILGFAQTFQWTGDPSFLQTSRQLADFFIENLPGDGVPYWDFDAPVTSDSPRDTSAAMIASCGMLLIYRALRAQGKYGESEHYLFAVRRIVEGTLTKFLNPPTFKFIVQPSNRGIETYEDGLPCDHEEKPEPGFLAVSESVATNGINGKGVNGTESKKPVAETILTGATINNYEFAPRRWANHGLVYADYYFMLLGNMLLELGLVPSLP